MIWSVVPSSVMVVVELVVHGVGINPQGERSTRNQKLVVLRAISDGVKRLANEC
jgi:hypothetical protein